MTDSGDETDNLFRLATKVKPKAEPHLFAWPVSMPANPKLGRDQQTERECLKCHLVKITVHPADGPGYRLYRWGDGPTQFYDPVMPECTLVVPAKSAEAAA